MSVKTVKAKMQQCGVVKYPGSSLKPGVPYQPLPFPEFLDIPSQRPMAWLEWFTIFKHIHHEMIWPQRILDIGANIGLHTFLWAQLGCQVTATEQDTANLDVLWAVKEWGHFGNVDIQSHYEPLQDSGPTFDLVVCLNVHQWMVKRWGVKKAQRYVTDLCARTKWIAFQTAHAGGYGEVTVGNLRTQRDCIEFLRQCGKNRVTVIGRSGYKKPRWLLWGE